jgi:hypothetical protein
MQDNGICLVERKGVELPAKSSGKPHIGNQGGAKSGALGRSFDGSAGSDPALARLVEAWPGLPENVREAVLRLVEGVDVAEATGRKD